MPSHSEAAFFVPMSMALQSCVLYDMIYRLSIMILLAFASVMCKGESARIFDIIIGGEGQRTCLRLPRGCDSIKAALYCHQNMTEEVLFRSNRFCRQMDSLDVAMIFVQ